MKRMTSFGYGPNKLFGFCCTSCVAVVAAVTVFCIGGAVADEEGPFMQGDSYYAQNTDVMLDKSAYSAVKNPVAGATSSVVMKPGDAGLNTTLIAQMTEGYCKDYLTICLEASNGSLSNSTSTMPFEAPISIPVLETGFYRIGDNKTIPASDLPKDRVENYTPGALMTWGKKERSIYGGFSKVGGPFQYISDSPTELQYKSKYSLHTGEKGDCYNFADCAASVVQFLAEPEKSYILDESNAVSDEVKIMLSVNSHNRGGGGCEQAAYGYRYMGTGSKLSQGLKGGDANAAHVCNQFQVLSDDLLTDLEGKDQLKISNMILENSQNKAMSWPMLFHRGWYIDRGGLEKAKRSNWLERSLELWNYLYPTEVFSNVNAYAEYIGSKYVRSLSEVSGISKADCARYFNTNSDGMYESYYSGGAGNLFKVTDSAEELYVKDFGKAVMCFDDIAMHHILIAIQSPKILYAKMLAYSGVSVDPTNPETYTNMMVATSVTQTPQWSADAPTWLSAYGVTDTSGYGPARIALLNAAYEVAFKDDGSRRAWYLLSHVGYNGDLESIKHLDCSSYVMWSYAWAADKYGYDLYWNGFPGTTASYSDNNTRMHPIDVSDGKAGDIAVCKGTGVRAGHVIIFLSQIDNTNVNCLQCSGEGTKIGRRGTTSIVPKAATSWYRPNYRLFRYYDGAGTEMDMMTKK